MSTEAGTRRGAGPDQFKAILLAFVIFGHTYAQPQSQDLGKWLIYGFHMPAFLFLSGYLLNADRLRARPFERFLAHYWRRMLAAWLVVCLAYLAVYDRGAFDSVPHAVRMILLTPPFHLWYVPALFGAVLLARFLSGSPPGRLALAAIALLGMLAFETPLGPAVLPPAVPAHIDHHYFGYLGWFVLGLAVRNGWLRVPAAKWRILAVMIGAVAWTVGYFGHTWTGDLGFVVLNLGVTLSVPAALRMLAGPIPVIGDGLVRIGRYSLWVYLLHPFVTGPLQVAAIRPLWEQRLAGLALTGALLLVAAVVTRPRNARRQIPPGRDMSSVVPQPNDENVAGMTGAEPPSISA